MPHHVYANNNEIASKSSDGKSSAAAPDVCFTTPPSVAGGTPVPFANTCSAKDITNGSKTVFIKNAEVALENKSFFKKSTGDEGATQAHKKGIVSGKITGKCYFVSWSPNVKVEGLSVARHMDSVTHNHTNQANTPIQKFRSVFNTAEECRRDKEDIARKCKPLTDDDKQNRNNRRKGKGLLSYVRDMTEKMDDVGKSYYGYNNVTRSNRWMDDYCGGMWVKPRFDGMEGFQEEIEGFKSDLENAQQVINHYMENTDEILESTLGQIIREVGPDEALEVMLEHAATSAIPTPTKLLRILKAGGSVLQHGISAASYMDNAQAIVQKLGSETAQELFNNMDFLLNQAKERFESALSDVAENPDKLMAELMSVNGEMDPCLKARKCQLVTYNSNSRRNVDSGDGCCPGQTAHHVIPNAAAEEAGCDGYSYGSAPTMCLEGQDNTSGSHGRAHMNLKDSVADYGKGRLISYESMRNKSLDSVKDSAEQCDMDCLRAQLDAAYENCGEMAAHDGGGGPWTREVREDEQIRTIR